MFELPHVALIYYQVSGSLLSKRLSLLKKFIAKLITRLDLARGRKSCSLLLHSTAPIKIHTDLFTWKLDSPLWILSLKRKLSAFIQSLFSTKKSPKVVNLPLTKRSVWVFDVTNRTNGIFNFQRYHQVVMYLFDSLIKSCTLY